ncbi:hypothetical protein SRABI83_02281 [Arthrobacter sp. Bi83]|uniref:hypothetical protein n=1 Tax=Arthrobacter sp. Bi83 TaxID=2822353 RepID=UPI001DC1F6B9|nr:hypothetical protein [Arthrobacter sp. Bi83]CAH0216843.1 hypothetical protein SRABI83_02281 [Arthrobacter sp. Bi83]
MFVEIDDYVVNLARVDNIAISCCVDDTEENPWDLSIEIGDDFELRDPVWLRQGFSTENRAKRFRQDVIRRAFATGICTAEDMDEIFEVAQQPV